MSCLRRWFILALLIAFSVQFSNEEAGGDMLPLETADPEVEVDRWLGKHKKGEKDQKNGSKTDAKNGHKDLKSGSKKEEEGEEEEDNDNYRVQYETKFAFQNVDEFGLKVKYNKTEHVFYGDNPPEQTDSKDHPNNVTNHHGDHGDKKPEATPYNNEAGDSNSVGSSHVKNGELYANYPYSQKNANDTVTLQDYFMKTGIESLIRKKNTFILPYKDKDDKWKNLEFKYSKMCLKPKKCRSKREAVSVSYYLYTKKNADDPFRVTSFEDFRLKSSYFNQNHTTIFLIHGWFGNKDESLINLDVRKAYMDTGNYNILVVDWAASAADLDYAGRVVPDSIIIGNKVGKFIKSMIDAGYTKHRILKMIGHDLGAHMTGVIAKKIPGKIYSIVALEPSIGFKKENGGSLLTKEAAGFVEVIHTSSLGLDYPIGHVDFFVNGGETQPGCQFLDSISHGSCSHTKVCDYYAATVKNPKQFQAVPCRSMNDVKDRTCFSASYDKFYMGGAEPNRLMDGIFTVRTSGHRLLPL